MVDCKCRMTLIFERYSSSQPPLLLVFYRPVPLRVMELMIPPLQITLCMYN